MPDKRRPFEEFAEDDVREPLGSEAGTDTDEVPPATEAAASEKTAAASDAARKRDEYHDLLLRTRAEFDNYRKRVDRERQDLASAAAADLLRDLLPLVDDFERALSVEADASDAYRKGVELIHQKLVDLLARRGVKPIEAVGADFDPHVHQAVVHEPVEGRREGEVVEEFRRGYKLGDRLLRPAMVKVAKA